jgi:two-component system chemotaxis response regulator CheV
MNSASILDNVDKRTNLAGRNRLELLLFDLGTPQTYALNVFKVREVISTENMKLTAIPNRPQQVIGSTHVRGKTIEIIDLSAALYMPPQDPTQPSYIIITEFNRLVQGFLVSKVIRIVNMGWSNILPPPAGLGSATYLTAVAKLKGETFAEVIDVEKILAEILGLDTSVDNLEDVSASTGEVEEVPPILVVDDSSMAHKQITVTLDEVGIGYKRAWNGEEALEILEEAKATGIPMNKQFLMIIADIEMPKMDGYTLTTKIKADAELGKLYVVLHTSLSGIFNKNMVQKVGANAFLTKFSPKELKESIEERIEKWRDREDV